MRGHDVLFDHEQKLVGFAEANCQYGYNNGLQLSAADLDLVTEIDINDPVDQTQDEEQPRSRTHIFRSIAIFFAVLAIIGGILLGIMKLQ